MTQPSARIRVVVDTNLFVSGTILKRGNPYALLTAWRSGAFILLVSKLQHAELREVFQRPKLIDRYRLTADELADLFACLTATLRVEPTPTLSVPIRDAKDEHILGAGLGGEADYLVTGDDLLVLRDDPRLGTLRIVTVADFLAVLERNRLDQPDNTG